MIVLVAFDIEGGVAEVAPEDGGHAEFVGVGEGLGNLDNFPVGVVGSKVDRGTDGGRAHVMSGFDFSKENFLEGVRVGEEFVVVDFDEEWNLVRVFARDRAEDAEGRADGVATAFDGELDDVLGIEISGVFGEAGAGGALDALVDGQDRDISRAGEAAGIVDPLEVVQNALIPVGLREYAVDEVRAGKVELILRNGLRSVL